MSALQLCELRSSGHSLRLCRFKSLPVLFLPLASLSPAVESVSSDEGENHTGYSDNEKYFNGTSRDYLLESSRGWRLPMDYVRTH